MTRWRGAALPVVLLAVALVSALAAGGLAASRGLARSARLPARGAVLQGAAERALTELVAVWDTATRAAQPVGVVLPAPSRLEDGVRVATWSTRIGERTWWLVAEAAVDAPWPFRRRLGLFIHINGAFAAPVPARAWAPLP